MKISKQIRRLTALGLCALLTFVPVDAARAVTQTMPLETSIPVSEADPWGMAQDLSTIGVTRRYQRPQVERAAFLDDQIERGLLRLGFLLRRSVGAVSRSLRNGAEGPTLRIGGCQLGCTQGDGGRGRSEPFWQSATLSTAAPAFFPLPNDPNETDTISQLPPLDNRIPPAVPLPPTAPLILAALGGFLLVRRRRQTQEPAAK